MARVYEDPAFRSYATYAPFVKRLFDLQLVSMSLTEPVEQVGIFFVRKKGGKLRLILDCRRSNCHFEEPEPVRLTTGEALSRLEIEPGQKLFTASADLQNTFYTMGMPHELRRYFGLKKVPARDMAVTQLEGKQVCADQWIYPVIAVIPMGWSHALWWCQRVNERICRLSGLRPTEQLKDGQPAPAGDFFHVQYVDNLHIFGTNEDEVKARFWKAVQALRDTGLTVHEIELGEGDTKVLGWSVHESGLLAPTLSRLWRLRLGIREVLRRGAMTGQQLERLIGHMTFVSLCRRESLAALGHCYTFIRRFYSQRTTLWKSVRRELQQWDGLAPLVLVDMKLSWGETIYSVDASDWGLGVTTGRISRHEAQRLGRFVERWRFKEEASSNPRLFVRTEDERLVNPQSGLVSWHGASGVPFETVGFESLDRAWKTVGRHRWLRPETMPVYEARATQYALRHALRNVDNFGKKFLILTDSMTAAVAYDKGRAHGYRLRRVLQQTAALCLGCGISFRSRWIPSEWNPADGPSRGGWLPSAPVRRFWEADDTPAPRGSSDLEAGAAGTATPQCEYQQLPAGSETCSDQGGQFEEAAARGPSDLGHRAQWRERPSQAGKTAATQAASSRGRPTQQPAAVLSVGDDPPAVQARMGGTGAVVGPPASKQLQLGTARQTACELSGVPIPGRGGSESSELYCSGCHVHEAGNEDHGGAAPRPAVPHAPACRSRTRSCVGWWRWRPGRSRRRSGCCFSSASSSTSGPPSHTGYG